MKKIGLLMMIMSLLFLYGCGSKQQGEKVTDTEYNSTVKSDISKNEESEECSTLETKVEETTKQETTVLETTVADTTGEETTLETQTSEEEIITEEPTTAPPPPTTTIPRPTFTTPPEPIPTTTTTTKVNNLANGAFKEFSVTTLDGQVITQNTFSKADVNVVIIWTTWCGYCKLELPALQKVMDKFSGQSVQFFSVVCDVGTFATEDEAKYWIDECKVTFPCLIYNDSMSDGYMEELTGYPNTLYLNKNGEIMKVVGGAYAANGEDYAIDAHSYYLEYFLNNPDYMP